MRRVFEVPARRIPRRLRDCLANRRLHLIRVGLGHDPVEVQINGRLVDAVEVLQVRECDQSAIGQSRSSNWPQAGPRRCLRPRSSSRKLIRPARDDSAEAGGLPRPGLRKIDVFCLHVVLLWVGWFHSE